MKNRYWIKQYIGLLHDHHMAKLDALTWRHAVELFLLAGETGDNGNVGSLENAAWQLRVGEEEMLATLEKLSALGVVHEEQGAWVVSNFVERQRPSTSTERVRAFRQRKKEAALFREEESGQEEGELDPFEEGKAVETDETEMKQDGTAAAKRFPSASGSASDSYSDSYSLSASGSDFESGEETNFENVSSAGREVQPDSWVLPGEYSACAVELDMLTPEAMQELRPSLGKHPPQWVADAIREAKRYNASSPRYVQAILDRWGVEGRESQRGRKVLKKPIKPVVLDRHRYLTDGYAEFLA